MRRCKSVCGFFRGKLLELGTPEVSSTNSIPSGFCRQKLWGLIFLVLKFWAGGPGVELDLLPPGIPLPNFYVPYVHVGPALSVFPPLLPLWMGAVL